MYVVNAEYGTVVVRRKFSCTRGELLRELSRVSGIPMHDITYHARIFGDQMFLSDQDLERIYKGATHEI